MLVSKQQSSSFFHHVFITKNLVDRCTVSLQTKEGAYTFPLYLYTEDGSKIPNLKKEIVGEIKKIVDKVSPEDILDWSEPLRLDTLSLNTLYIPESYSLPITSRIPPEADSLKRNATSSYYTHLK